MSEVRWGQVAAPVDPELLPHAALNHFWHNKVMGGPESQAGGSPNNDTLYSIAWLDLSKEPVILPFCPRSWRPLLYDGDRKLRLRQLCICRHEDNGDQGRQLCHRRTIVEGRTTRRRPAAD